MGRVNLFIVEIICPRYNFTESLEQEDLVQDTFLLRVTITKDQAVKGNPISVAFIYSCDTNLYPGSDIPDSYDVGTTVPILSSQC